MIPFIVARQGILNTPQMIYSKHSLHDDERRALLDVAESACHVDTIPGFKSWIAGPVRAYFPHERMVCAVGQLYGDEIRVRHLLGVNCPESCLRRFDCITRCSERRVVQRWLSQYRAQVINTADMPHQLSPLELENAMGAGLSNIAAFGCLDVGGQGGTYFSFGRIPGLLNSRHAYKLELLVPCLHQTLTRLFHPCSGQLPASAHHDRLLTRREHEILALVAAGMSNRAIAEKLSRSELTVQNHVHAILKKLGVRNRVGAVASYRAFVPDVAAQSGAGTG